MLFNIVFKTIRKTVNVLIEGIDKVRCVILFKGNNVSYKNFTTSGTPYIMVARGGVCQIGNHFAMNNGIKGNPIGCYRKCTVFVDRSAELVIGEHVGISQAAIICHKKITIGDYVKIGGGVCIYDTDFHSLDPAIRKGPDDLKNRKEKQVVIKDNAFIGAYSLILKGVTIGENSIVGAGSVVTESIPDNQIWAGSPAKFIRNI